MSLYDLFLGGLETKKSNSLHYTLGKMVLDNLDIYEQIESGYYDGSIMDNNTAMYSAAQGGHKELVEYFISKGANYWNDSMQSAMDNGHYDLVYYFICKGADTWDKCMYYYIKDKQLLKYFRKLAISTYY